MSEMVERVARAMFDCYGGYDAATQQMLWEQSRYTLVRQAERAIEAMREPTEEMIEAYDNFCDEVCFPSIPAEHAMRVLIDAALK